jgi:hypothetical protein
MDYIDEINNAISIGDVQGNIFVYSKTFFVSAGLMKDQYLSVIINAILIFYTSFYILEFYRLPYYFTI